MAALEDVFQQDVFDSGQACVLSSSVARPAGLLEDKAATDVKQEVVLALEAAGPPAHSLLSRLAGATPGALGCSAAAAEKVLKRKADLISSPSLPHHLQPVLQGMSSLSEVSLKPQCTWCLCTLSETWSTAVLGELVYHIAID